MYQLAHVGAFTLSNYGDQLYPGLLDAFLAREQIESSVDHYALQPGILSDGRRVRDLRRVSQDGVDAVFMGGGDLIRCDRHVVALDHLEVGSAERRSIDARVRARIYSARNLRDGPGPWLPRNGWGAPAAWISVGVHDLPSLSAAVLAPVRSAWVRTPVGRERLIAAGMDGARCHVAPDAAFALAELIDVERCRSRGRELLELATGAPHGVVVLQVAGFHGWDVERVARLVGSFGDIPVALLPLGRYAGEHELLGKAAAVSDAAFLGLLPVEDVTAILSAAGCVVTTSMHAAFVAGTLGRPVIVPGVEKTATALLACPEPPDILSRDDQDIASSADALRAIDSVSPSGANAAAVFEAFRLTADRLLS
jgi:Polysaccharide pyruvyl transferase